MSVAAVRALTTLILLALASGPAPAAPVLDRNPADYFILAARKVWLKNLVIDPPGCHVGVNCPRAGTSSRCGVLHGKHATIAPPGQLTSDSICATGSFFEVFRHEHDFCGPDCTMISDPGSGFACGEDFTAPILADLDGDGTPSCDAACNVDRDDLAVVCGVTLPLPACDRTKPVLVSLGTDCSINDTIPGNMQCDLAPGVYGPIMVTDGARLFFGPGTTVACSLKAGKGTRVTGVGPSTLLVPGTGAVQLNDQADVGGTCSTLKIVTERGTIRFGHAGDYTLDACALGGKLALGHGNTLQGHFVGDGVGTDRSSEGRCCAANPSPCGNAAVDPGEACDPSAPLGDVACPGQCGAPDMPGACTCLPLPTTTTTLPPVTTTSTSTTSTSTSTSSPSTTHDPGTSTSTTNSSLSTTSSSSTTTTSTSLPPHGGFTRTAGFYKNHPTITQSILTSGSGLTVCGYPITDIDVDHAHSALEGLCIAPGGNPQLQLVRQLIAAGLNGAAGGAVFPDYGRCNAVCADAGATAVDVSTCIDEADAFNNSGDQIIASFDPPGPASVTGCKAAAATSCTVLTPNSCAQP